VTESVAIQPNRFADGFQPEKDKYVVNITLAARNAVHQTSMAALTRFPSSRDRVLGL
jgi:hypothetical protein